MSRNSKKTSTLLKQKNSPVQKMGDKVGALKKKVNTDNVIDFSVDVGIVAFDVLSSPILIIVRSIRYFFNKYVNSHIKRFLKWFAHKVLRL